MLLLSLLVQAVDKLSQELHDARARVAQLERERESMQTRAACAERRVRAELGRLEAQCAQQAALIERLKAVHGSCSDEGDMTGDAEGPEVSEGASNVTPSAPRPEKVSADKQTLAHMKNEYIRESLRFGFYKHRLGGM